MYKTFCEEKNVFMVLTFAVKLESVLTSTDLLRFWICSSQSCSSLAALFLDLEESKKNY